MRSGLRRSSARQAPMSCWRRGGGGGGGGAPDDGSSRSDGEVSGSSRSDLEVPGSSASGKGRDPGSGFSLVGGGSIGRGRGRRKLGLGCGEPCLPGSGANWGLIDWGIGWLAGCLPARGGGNGVSLRWSHSRRRYAKIRMQIFSLPSALPCFVLFYFLLIFFKNYILYLSYAP